MGIIIILLIVIILLIAYLFVIKKDLKRIKKEIIIIDENNSNNLIHSEIPLKELEDLVNQINILMREEQEKSIEIEIKNLELKRMITNISHDLRTPLTSALGYVNILLSSKKHHKDNQELKIIEERLKKLEELINSFFDLSKHILQNKEFEFEEINLISALEESIANNYDRFNNESRSIIFNSNESKIKILSNKIILERVFDNLIINSFKHSVSDLHVKVDNSKKLKITFSNELSNSELDIEHIFDEFYTFDISRTSGNTGLGLAIAKQFIESLNGNIYATKDRHFLNIVIELER